MAQEQRPTETPTSAVTSPRVLPPHRTESGPTPNSLRPKGTLMSGLTIGTRGALARVAVVATVTELTAISLASPASARVYDHNIGVTNCGETSQLCPTNYHEAPGTNITGQGEVSISFTASQNHCSDMIPHIYIDDFEPSFIPDRIGPGQTAGPYGALLPAGTAHFIGVQAEGITGGCNRGVLGSWAGTLHIETSG
jgi:hypothetical protein